MSRTEFQDALQGFSVLRRLEFFVQPRTGVTTLVVDLVRDDSERAEAVRATFEGVSNLSAQNLGGGLTQLLYLVVEDIKDQQLDRLRYSVCEAERDSIRFLCRTVAVERVVPP